LWSAWNAKQRPHRVVVLILELTTVLQDLAEADAELVLVPAVREALDLNDRHDAVVAEQEIDTWTTMPDTGNDPVVRKDRR
jgi:hypothetical protein